ncbi:hypothetical protein FB382_001928 [Nocardioides ginsengisegetis]|uniref:DUF222 domain-containing protein n=1 Tax=Nocardioides ginsengisegetis TaxID=661491 RepID=A0A7W3P9P4_9ACTN|nr:hypothetical protein [Nocardioides ginsengisegetis]MBA8803637.1 hypothetical protein [Nocardioides ginsengisegetis]
MALGPVDAPGDILTAAERALRAKRAAEAEILCLAVAWADQHPGETIGQFGYTPRGGEQAVRMGGEGTPEVADLCPAELGLSLEIHPIAARHLIADALDLRHRLPSFWTAVVHHLAMPDWVARKVASLTRGLTSLQVAEVDRALADVAATLPPSRLLRTVEAMVLAADNETADREREGATDTRFATLDREPKAGNRHLYARLEDTDALALDATISRVAELLAAEGDEAAIDVRRSRALGILANPEHASELLAGRRPSTPHGAPAVLYLHLTETDFTRDADGVARFEQDGPITLAHARHILGHRHVTIKPVIDLTQELSSDAYEFTGSLREAVLLRTPADCFPYAVATTGRRDVDHSVPFDPHGPPGQTNTGNGGPLTRHHHRIKTHGRMSVRQPWPGLYVWRTPHRRYRVTDHRGTRTISTHIGDCLFDGDDITQGLALLVLDAL